MVKMMALIFISAMLSGCMTIGGHSNRSEVTGKLKDVFGYEPELIDECTVKSSYKKIKKDYYYEFEDIDGMRFTYSVKLTPQGVDGATFYYSYVDDVNYYKRIMPFYSDTIRDLCDEYGCTYEPTLGYNEEKGLDKDFFGNDIQHGGSAIRVDGFDDLENAAELVTKILDQCRLNVYPSGILTNNRHIAQIMVFASHDIGGGKIGEYQLLRYGDEVDKEEIYNQLRLNYIEGVKKRQINNDIPESILENTAPQYLKGRFNGRVYDLWSASLQTEESKEQEESLPEYTFEILYREPMEREDYKYYEGYYSMDLRIYNIIAQLGGECTFSESYSNGDGPGFTGSLCGDEYYFGFAQDHKVLIRKNGEEKIYDTTVKNVANDTYSFILTREEMEDLFNIKITYNIVESIFDVELAK